MLNLRLCDVPLVFLDLETTGLSPYGDDRICEVALQRVTGGIVEVTLDQLIDPQRPLSAQAFRVNRIDSRQLAGAPVFAKLSAAILAPLAGAVLVAHNAPFDVGFLNAELGRTGLPPLDNPVIDTLVLARRLLPGRRSHSLAALVEALGARPPRHRAMADVLALRAVFDDLLERLAPLQIVTLGETLRYARGFSPGDPEPAVPPIIAAALREGTPLRIVYASLSSPEPTERVIRPLELTSERGGFYLRAYCHLRDDVRSFALKKILKAEIMNYEL